MGGEEITRGETQGSSGGGNSEKILVSIRVRPLNEKEIGRNDLSDWECVNNTTILCRNNLPERSLFPSAYTFDRVFGIDIASRQVYEEGAKEVALCVLRGINSSIFAYGQTSSGKTYTMNGITQYAMDDIFEYIQKHREREFTLKFSAMEIYNEAVRDLLSSDNTQLRLLDDPERGTVVEKLSEETLRDRDHLEELFSICETQRKIGETSLNEMSSRSHQILRLTVESSAREYSGDSPSALASSVSFVDLAGSERASQTLSAGTRLKEGCHINRSLLTLGTVIRKLSKGKNGHVPYRDSKLTRILQNSLGGNARTAIICTMSPARSHVEQSRNTLLFASCAKEVATNAQVNLVVSEKALVKQLQKELEKMERELKSLGSISVNSDFSSLLKEKEELIEKMERQVKDLTWQRDLAQSRVEDLLQSVGSSKHDEFSMASSLDIGNPLLLEADSKRRQSGLSRDSDEPRIPNFENGDYLDLSENSDEEGFLLDNSTPQFSGLDTGEGWEEIATRTNEVPEDVGKGVICIESENSNVNREDEKEDAQQILDVVVDKKAIVEVLSPGSVVKDQPLSMEFCAKDEKFELSPESQRVEFGEEEKNRENGKPLSMEYCAKDEEFELSSESQRVEFGEDDKNRENEKPLSMECCAKDEDVELSPESQSVEFGEDNKNRENEKPLSMECCAKDEEFELSPESHSAAFVEDDKIRENKKSSKIKDQEIIQEDLKNEQTESSLLVETKDNRQVTKMEEPEICDKKELKGSPLQVEDRDTENITYEALKEKVKEMQKTIEYLMSMHALEQQSSSSETDFSSPGLSRLKRSRSCREILFSAQSPLWFEKSEHKDNNTSRDLFMGRYLVPSRRLSGLKDSVGPRRFSSHNSHASSTTFDVESTVSSPSIDAQSIRDSDTENGGSFHEFMAGMKEMVSGHQSNDEQFKKVTNELGATPECASEFETGKSRTKKIKAENVMKTDSLGTSPTVGLVTQSNEKANSQSEGEFGDGKVKAAASEKTDSGENNSKETDMEKDCSAVQPNSSWPSDFERQQREIIQLWGICNVPLVHRTYFFLLFKGDPSDFVYMEVELRRLSFLKDSMSRDSEALRRQSIKGLNREREWLSKQVPKKFSRKKKVELYQKWGVKLNTKQRSLQVVQNLWTDTLNMEHIKESASLVAKLVGFAEPSQAPKEMFGLSLSPASANRRSPMWKHSKSLSSISFLG